jgi:hypothetical protein
VLLQRILTTQTSSECICNNIFERMMVQIILFHKAHKQVEYSEISSLGMFILKNHPTI